MTRWVPVSGYEETHEVSDFGEVRRVVPCGRIRDVPHTLKKAVDKDGYYRGIIRGNKTYKAFGYHRLVAEHFVVNPSGFPQVNHIDGNKKNNHYTNLEWVDHSGNQRHKVDILRSGIKKYEVTHPDGRVEIVYNLAEFARTVGISRAQFANVIRGYRETTHGFKVKGPL